MGRTCITKKITPTSYKESGNPEKFYNNIKRGICSHFGCKKRLSLQESLQGERCIDHPKTKSIDASYFVQFPNKKK